MSIPATLLLLVGPPGTGKSYLARRISERFPVAIVETDEIRRRIANPPTYSLQESQRVYLMAQRRIDQLLQEGLTVLFDATNLYEGGRRRLYHIAERNHARLLIIRTTAPEPVIEERLRLRKLGVEPLDLSEAGWEVYSRMKGEFQDIRRPHLVIDTSKDLKPAIESVLSFLRNEQ